MVVTVGYLDIVTLTVKFLLGNKSVNNCNISTCHYGTSMKSKQIINVLPSV